MKLKPSPLALLAACGLLVSTAPAHARRQQQQTPAQQDEPEVIRVTTNLVQLDAVVTDREGRQVTDLRPEDFEVLEEGRPQKITNFSYVAVGTPRPKKDSAAAAPTSSAAQPAPPRAAAPSPPAPPARLGRAGRTLALIVDNLRMSHGSVGRVRDGLRKFVEEQVEPGDLVGVFETRGGSGVLQQFTSDKSQMLKAVEAVRWYPPVHGPAGIDVYERARNDSLGKTVRPGQPSEGDDERNFEDKATRERREADEDRASDANTSGSLGALRMVVRSMERAPGRRAAVLFGDEYKLFSRKGRAGRAREALVGAIDAANRAGVVVYTVDTKGVFDATMIAAIDDPKLEMKPHALDLEGSEDPTEDIRQRRYTEYIRSQDGFAALADATGGRFLKTANDLDRALARVLREQSGYYLIGYRPSEETFRGGRDQFRDISVKVRRPGLSVRSRKGFLAFADEPARATAAAARGTEGELYRMLAAPITASDVGVRMTAGVAAGPQGAGQVAQLLLHVDGRGVTLTDEPGGWKKLVLDVAAVTLDGEGRVADQFTRTHTVRAGGDTLERIRENGLVYAAEVPVKKPGSYQLRVVVRDHATQRVGSASQFIEAPDLSKGRLAMSGLSLREAAEGVGGQPAPAPATAETALAPVMSQADPAVRRFRPGAILFYGYQVYNAAPDPATRRPRLTARLRLFHDGQLVAEGEPVALDAPGHAEGAGTRFEEAMRVVPNAKPGEYVLQVVVADALAKDGAEASQWINFEVVR